MAPLIANVRQMHLIDINPKKDLLIIGAWSTGEQFGETVHYYYIIIYYFNHIFLQQNYYFP